MPREPIKAGDAIWLQDSDTNLMVINAVFVTDRLDLETVRTAFRRRIFEGQDATRFERLRCRIEGTGHRRYWAPDPAFDLARHVAAARGKHPRTLEGLRAYVGREASRPLDGDHPRWEVQVFEEMEEESSALLVRIHHSIGDGEALVSLLFALVDDTPVKGGALQGGSALPAPCETFLARLLRAAAIPLSAPGILLRRLTWSRDRSPMHGAALSGHKHVAWTRPLELDLLKQAKPLIGATVNDVLMASVSGAFSHYLQEHGGKAPSRFLVNMPVNVRGGGGLPRLDNHFAPVPLDLPAGPCSGRRLILAVKDRMDRLKCSPVPQVIFELQRALLAWLPQAVSRFLIDFLANKCTAVVTNVKGPAQAITFQGRRVRTLLFWVPQRARIGIGVSILSLGGKVQVGIIADEALLPDPAALVKAFEEEFEALGDL